MKTPEQTAAEELDAYIGDSDTSDGFDRDDLRAFAVMAIEADRAQFFDTAGSASRQHYIDTGRYMLHEEVAEMERINGR